MEIDIFYEGGKWFSTDSLSDYQVSSIKRDLTLVQDGYQDAKSIPFYEEVENTLVVPRHWTSRVLTERVHDLRTDGESDIDLVTDWKARPERGQDAAIDAMVDHIDRHGAGVLQAYTGCGKTVMALLIAARLKKRTLVLVYNEHMMKYWCETVREMFSIEPGVIQGDTCVISDVTIGMVQSLAARDYDEGVYHGFGFIVADEVNRFAAPVWQTVMNKFFARRRMGMTASSDRKDGLQNVVTWNFGRVAHKISDKKKIAKPSIFMIRYEHRYPVGKYMSRWGPNRGNPDPMKYRKLLSEDAGRNRMILSELSRCVEAGRKALVFSNYRNHVIGLHEALSEVHPEIDAQLLIGGVKDIETAMKGDFIFTTYAFAREAINLLQIDTLFFATPPGDPLQPLGRLRDGGPEKKPLLVVDFYEASDYSVDRAEKRVDFYSGRGLRVKRLRRAVGRGIKG